MKIWSRATPSTTTYTLFWLLVSCIWFATLGQRALIHPDEGRYAELSLGLLQSGDWITPRLNGILYFEKPILQYWMGALSYMVFGINEFAARFWPGLTGLLSVLTVGLTARRLWRCGNFAALVMAGSFWVIGNSHFLTLDAGLMFFMTLTLCLFLIAQNEGATDREKRYGMWLAWAAMAGATLSKGLIGIVIPGAVLVFYSLVNRDWSLWRRMAWLPGIAIFLTLAAPWFVLVSARNPGFADFFFIHEHFARYLTPEARREGPIWYFIPVLLAGFLPWTSLLPRLVREGWRRGSARAFSPERFLLVWAIFIFVFFSLSHSKLPSYILPLFPALALLLGRTLADLDAAALKKHLWLPVIVWTVFIVIYPFSGHLSSKNTPVEAIQHLSMMLAAGGLGFLGFAELARRYLNIGRKEVAVMLLALGSLLAVSLGSAGHNAFGKHKSSKDVVEQIRPYLHQDTQVFSVRGAYDQTFPFYLRRHVTQVDYSDEFAFGHTAEPGSYIPSIEGFFTRWKQATDAMAMLDAGDFQNFTQAGLPMKVIYRDNRRLVVIKP